MKSAEFIKEITSGATGAGTIATTPTGKGKKKKDIGTLFGGTYKQTLEATAQITEEVNLKNIMMKIDAAISNSLPDGDPKDFLPYIPHEVLDNAVRTHSDSENFYDYVDTVKGQTDPLTELDNGPRGTYDDGVKHGLNHSDPAKLDYSAYATHAKTNHAERKAVRDRERLQRKGNSTNREPKPLDYTASSFHRELEDNLGGTFEHYETEPKHVIYTTSDGYKVAAVDVSVTHSYSLRNDMGYDEDTIEQLYSGNDTISETHHIRAYEHPKYGFQVFHTRV